MVKKLSSLCEKETEDETKNLPEESIDCEVIVSKEAKKVRFNLENEVFEFTKSVKKTRRKNVRIRRQNLQQGGVELRRSNRIVAKGRNKNESNTRRISCSDVTDFEGHKTGESHMKGVLNVPDVEMVSRRSRLLNDIYAQEGKGRDNVCCLYNSIKK